MTKDNVIDLPVVTRLDFPPDKILEKAKGKLEEVVVIGWHHDGELFFASSKADGGNILWLIEKAKAELLMDDGE